jgi:hypothetical protein
LRPMGTRAVPIVVRLGQQVAITWEKEVLSAMGFKRVGRHSEYAI